MSSPSNLSADYAKFAHDQLLFLGQLSVKFSLVERALLYTRGRQENDSEHSFHLGLSATELAATYYPELDSGLVSQFCLVHDLPEVYAGDTPSYNISEESRQAKEKAEKDATERLLLELPPYLCQLLKRYEEQVEPEARFVRFVDKLLPAIIHAVAPDENREVFKDRYNLKSAEDNRAIREAEALRLKATFPEFDFIGVVKDLLSATSSEHIFKSKN